MYNELDRKHTKTFLLRQSSQGNYMPKNNGVDFTNVFACIFRARLSYERRFSSYVLQKMRAKNVGEIDPWLLMIWQHSSRPQGNELAT